MTQRLRETAVIGHAGWLAAGVAVSVIAPSFDGWRRVLAFAFAPFAVTVITLVRVVVVECRDRLAWLMIVLVGFGSALAAVGNVLEIDLGLAETGRAQSVVGLGLCCIGAAGASARFASGMPLIGRLAARSRYLIVAVPALLTLGAQWVRAIAPARWVPGRGLHAIVIALAVGGLLCVMGLSIRSRGSIVSPSIFRLLGALSGFVLAGAWAPAFTAVHTNAFVLMSLLGAAHGLLGGASMHPSMASAGSPHGTRGALGLLGPAIMLVASISTFVAVATIPGPIPTYVAVLVSSIVVAVGIGCGATLVRSGPTADLRTWFDPRRRELVDEFVQALTHGQLTLHYQPIIRLHDGRASGAEALVRWPHSERGILGAAVVLELAGASRHEHDLNAWVVGQVARDLPAILGCLEVDEPLVTFNVSPAHLRPGFARMVGDALTRAGTAPEGLAVELTEIDAYVLDDQMLHELEALQELGVFVAIDDFGTGTSNIGVLIDVDADVLKIDRRLATGTSTEHRREQLLKVAVDVGRGIGALVVIEGIETDDELAAIAPLGAHYAQGYVFARPMPLSDLVSYTAALASGDSSPLR